MKKASLIFIILLLLPTAVGVAGIETSYSPYSTTSVSAPDKGNIRLLSVKYDPYPAEPGNYVRVWVSVQNWGEETIKNTVIKLEPEYPFSFDRKNEGIKEIGLLPGFRDALVEYKLRVDEGALEGDYNLTVKLCKDSSCTDWVKEIGFSVNVKTGGSPKIEVGIEEMDLFTSATTGTITLNIVNKGRLDSKFLTLTLLPTEKYEILSPNRVYIGELESDDFETAEFKIFVKESVGATKSEEIILPIKLEYSDTNYKEYEETASVNLKVYSQSDLEQMHLANKPINPLFYILIIVALILGYIAYRKVGKRKR